MCLSEAINKIMSILWTAEEEGTVIYADNLLVEVSIKDRLH